MPFPYWNTGDIQQELMKNYIRTGSYVISSKLAGKEVTRWVPRSM